MRGGLAGFAAGALVAVGAGVGAIAACSDGVQADVGISEPIQLSGAQFIPGTLPGSPPENGQGDAGATPPPLTVTSLTFTNAYLVAGIGGTSMTGLVTSDAVAVGVAEKGAGSGYWVVPVQAPDIQFPGQSDFGFSLALNPLDKAGLHSLLAVALDANGNAGQQTDVGFCIESRVPDNQHACVPRRPVPPVIFSLTWDTNFDVDLHVVTPDGRDVNAKTAPTSVPLEGGIPGPNVALIDRDSIGSCVVDGWREEDLVFDDPPPKGSYLLYASPFSACAQTYVNFTMTIWEAESDGNLHATFTRSGELLANDATGGVSTGLFVAEKTFE